MLIEELKEGEVGEVCEEGRWSFGGSDPKRVLVGAGARALFYPTLVYNVVRNKLQTEFRWWDKVDEVWFCNLYMLELGHVFNGVESLLFCCSFIF